MKHTFYFFIVILIGWYWVWLSIRPLRRQRYELKGSTEAFQSVGSVLLKLSSRQQKMRQIQCIAFFVGKGLPK